ncbi:DUF1793-domain-containing protein [Thozetella sp. PMI_491]|nr:DUF1793-domain-containing protein [Thozetella sp. PMI_491]
MLLGALSVLAGSIVKASTFTPLRPPSIPLAVASPYLSTWLNDDTLPGNWPQFWTGSITGWQGFIAVDGTVYNWMGGAPGAALVTQTDFEYTSTRSIFTFNVADTVTLTATFLTPIYPDDLIMKSLQYSYLELSAVSADGAQHNVSVYSDISGEWMQGDASSQILWDTGNWDQVQYHRIRPANEVVFGEQNDQAAWGTVFFATSDDHGMSFQIGADTVVRNQFINNRILNNGVDTQYRAVNDNWPVFAFAHSLDNVGSTPVSTVFGIGICQVPAIQFQGTGDSPQNLTGQWYSKWSDGIFAMADWVNGYETQSAYATSLDDKVKNDATAAGGSDYAALTTLAVRQAFGGLTPAQGSTQSYLFLKEISSDSDIQTVDVIFPAFPILTYFNNTLVKLLLDPLFENQESGHYPKTSAIHDLGRFPKALGYPNGDDEPMPVEECGNMLILTLAYAQRTNDNAYLSQHYAKLQQWTQYLVDDSLIPAEQLSTDDFAGHLANQTNLALKGIIGIAAMGQIAQLTGNTDNYTVTAQDYISQWYGFGINSGATPSHTELSYGNQTSWGLLYNLYGDKLLGLDLVDASVYDMQSNFYPTEMAQYGVPLDTRHTYTKLDWEAWAAAIASPDTRAQFYSHMATWVANTDSRVPLTDLYETVAGTFTGFKARPVVGGLFAQLAL